MCFGNGDLERLDHRATLIAHFDPPQIGTYGVPEALCLKRVSSEARSDEMRSKWLRKPPLDETKATKRQASCRDTYVEQVSIEVVNVGPEGQWFGN